MQANMELRTYAREHGVPLWKVAQKLGVTEQTVIRWLRTPYDDFEAKQFKSTVDQIEREGK